MSQGAAKELFEGVVVQPVAMRWPRMSLSVATQRSVGPVLVCPQPFLESLPRPLAVLGEGITYHRPAIEAAVVQTLSETLWRPQPAPLFELGLEMAHMGRYTAGPDLLPLYIRRPEAEEKWEILHPDPGK